MTGPPPLPPEPHELRQQAQDADDPMEAALLTVAAELAEIRRALKRAR